MGFISKTAGQAFGRMANCFAESHGAFSSAFYL